MALSEDQIKTIIDGIEKGLSGRAIATAAQCGETAVRETKKRLGIQPNKLKTLAKKEIKNIIKAQVLKGRSEEENAQTQNLRAQKERTKKQIKANHIIEDEISADKSALNAQQQSEYSKLFLEQITEEEMLLGGIQLGNALIYKTIQKGTSTKVLMQGHGMGVTSPINVEVALNTKEIQSGVDTLIKSAIALGHIKPPGIDEPQDVKPRMMIYKPEKDDRY